MRSRKVRSPLNIVVLIFIVTALSPAFSQTPQQTKPTAPADDVVRIETNLVLTDVIVVDKKGRVVTGLKPNDFELRVDSKTQGLSFVDEVITGGAAEEKQLNAAREGRPSDKPTPSSPAPPASTESDRRPFIFFFVDDVHLGGEGWGRARSLLLNFLDHQMKPNDRVAIVSTSGQIGFLQQLTDNKSVLREAISRLNLSTTRKRSPAKLSSVSPMRTWSGTTQTAGCLRTSSRPRCASIKCRTRSTR